MAKNVQINANVPSLVSMPGIDLHYLGGKEDLKEIIGINNQISGSVCGGAVTGIPSFRANTQYGVLQTLDKLAFGFKVYARNGC